MTQTLDTLSIIFAERIGWYTETDNGFLSQIISKPSGVIPAKTWPSTPQTRLLTTTVRNIKGYLGQMLQNQKTSWVESGVKCPKLFIFFENFYFF
jgi:hypothetical protein